MRRKFTGLSLGTAAAGKPKKRRGSYVKDPRVAFERGYQDAQVGKSVAGVPYSNPDMAEAWAAGFDRRRQDALERNEPVCNLKRRRNTEPRSVAGSPANE